MTDHINPHPNLDDPDDDFDYWMSKVNDLLVDTCGLDSDELPDWDYRDAFDEGRTAASVIDDILANAGNF